MPATWILAPAFFAAGYLTCRQLHRRNRTPLAATPHDAVQDAARTAQHLHGVMRQLEDDLERFRGELPAARRPESTETPTTETSNPWQDCVAALTDKITTTRVELHEYIRRLINAADQRFDPATGLGSQREANRWMDTLLALMARYGNHFSIAIVAIDRSESIANLSEDHANQQLNDLGNLLRRATRETDILARYSEDELLIILPETDEDGAITMSQRVRKQVANELDFSVSLGIASALPGDSYKTLIHRADAALFAAQDQQGQGGGCRHTGLELELLASIDETLNDLNQVRLAPDVEVYPPAR